MINAEQKKPPSLAALFEKTIQLLEQLVKHAKIVCPSAIKCLFIVALTLIKLDSNLAQHIICV